MKYLEEALHVHPYRSDLCNEYNWQELCCCIVQVAKDVIGHGKQRQPEWFEDNIQTLTPLINAKNAAHNRMLNSNSAGARRAFRQSQWLVKKAVDEVKENCILSVAKEAEEAVKDGKTH